MKINIDLGGLIAIIICLIVLLSKRLDVVYHYIAFAGLLYLLAKGQKGDD